MQEESIKVRIKLYGLDDYKYLLDCFRPYFYKHLSGVLEEGNSRVDHLLILSEMSYALGLELLGNYIADLRFMLSHGPNVTALMHVGQLKNIVEAELITLEDLICVDKQSEEM